MDILDVHEKLKNKKISSVELVKDCLKKARESSDNVFISLTGDLALEQAKVAEERIYRDGPKTYLDGIPYTLKDLFITKGIRTTAASMMLYNYVPPYDGYVAETISDKGGILMGKVNCDEFGMGNTNENTPFGSIVNPYHSDFVAGGSSGGCAVSVSDGSSFYSMGTDTGGSIRLPANFCGLVALKPTYGRISRYGQIAYASSLDQAAPMGKTVNDLACILEYLVGYDDRDATSIKSEKMNLLQDILMTKASYLKGKRIGVDYNLIEQCSPGVRAGLGRAIECFKSYGAEVIELNFQYLKYAVSCYYIIATSEASSNLARYDGVHYGFRSSLRNKKGRVYEDSRSEGFGNEVKKRILLGTYVLSSGYVDAYYKKSCKVRKLIYDEFKKSFEKCDVVFSPVCANTAPRLGELSNNTVKSFWNDAYNTPANLAGLPALSLPFGMAENNLPTGFQLIGKSFGEKDLLHIGRSFELANE